VVVLYGVELSYATVLMSQSNRLLFESNFERSSPVLSAVGGAGCCGAHPYSF